MIQKSVTIINKLGLHARASSKLVSLASRFASQIDISVHQQTVNCKSIMGVMMLAASQGTDVLITVDGEDEVQALEAVTQLIDNRFDEDE